MTIAEKGIDSYYATKYFILELFMQKQIVDGISDELVHIPQNNSVHSLDGLYYSTLTNRIFFAKVEDGTVLISYTDAIVPEIDKEIELGIFHLQLNIGYYEALALCE